MFHSTSQSGQFPKQVGYDDPARRRSHKRAQIQVEVTIDSEHNFYSGFTENLSTGGLFIATHSLKEVGTMIDLEFQIPAHENSVKVIAEVRWVRMYNEMNDVPPGMGLKFIEISSDDIRRIEEFTVNRQPIFWD